MLERKLFGTDGIRGKANVYPMTCDMAMNLGRAVTHYFQTHHSRRKKPLIIVGKDTRLSCYMLELAFSSGVCAQGGRVVLTGPLPTPGVAFATRSMRATAGVMISASHNSYMDNGIKIFDGEGNKLADEVELEIEKMILSPELIPMQDGQQLGNAKRLDEVLGRYIVHVKGFFHNKYDLEGLKLVVDCANGAAYKVAPMIFEEMGAEVVSLGVKPNGQNINLNCGSLHPEEARIMVLKEKADLGICLDGDADRLVLIDSSGQVIDGDRLIGLFSKLLLDRKDMEKGEEVVGTVMSNLGLELYLKDLGLNFFRAAVGDRYIWERMVQSGSQIGGEPSGHIILSRHSTTGDGIMGALMALMAMKHYHKPINELVSEIEFCPQILKNIKVKKKVPFDEIPGLGEAMKAAEKKLKDQGRILLRYSGTEDLARVMVEGRDKSLVDKICSELVAIVTKEIGTQA